MKQILLLSFIGFLLSLYLYYIETKIKEKPLYKALCDISNTISCTAIAKSKYSSLAGVSNSLKGMVYYSLLAGVVLFDYSLLVFFLSVASMGMTVYLAYISYFKLKNYCLVCNAIYIVNLLLLYFSYQYI